MRLEISMFMYEIYFFETVYADKDVTRTIRALENLLIDGDL